MHSAKLFLFATVCLFSNKLASAQSADLLFLITDGQAQITVTAGIDPNGTTTYIPALDLLAPPQPPSGVFDARIVVEGEDYLQKRLSGSSTEGHLRSFSLTYKTGEVNAPVRVFWSGTVPSHLSGVWITDNITGTTFRQKLTSLPNPFVPSELSPLLSSGLRIEWDITAAALVSQSEWEASITVTQGTREERVQYGMLPSASNNYDQELDHPLPPVPPIDQYLRAAIYQPLWGNALGNEFRTDYRAIKNLDENVETWIFRTYAGQSGEATVRFSYPQQLNVPITVYLGEQRWHANQELVLTIPMIEDSIYTFSVEVGDITPPVVELLGDLVRPYIFESGQTVPLSYKVADANVISEIVVEASLDEKEWDMVYSGLSEAITWTIPQVSGLNESLKIRVRARDRAGNETEVTTSRSLSVASPRQVLSFDVGWRLASHPLHPVSSLKLGQGVRYAWLNDSYAERNTFDAGQGFWLGGYHASADTIVGSVLATSFQTRPIVGWTLMGLPMLRDVQLDSIIVRKGVESFSFQQALDSIWVTLPVFYEDETYVQRNVIDPFDGFWMGVLLDGLDIEFPVHDISSDLPSKGASEDHVHELALIVTDGRIAQPLFISTNRQVPAPPAAPGGYRMGFVGQDSPLGSLYLTAQASLNDQAQMPLVLRGPSRTVTLSWPSQDSELNATLYVGEVAYPLNVAGQVQVQSNQSLRVITQPANPTSTGSEDLAQLTALHGVFPNPVLGQAQFNWTLSSPSHVSVRVYDSLGRLVVSTFEGWQPAGNHYAHFTSRDVAPGVYVVRMQTGSTMLSRSFVIVE